MARLYPDLNRASWNYDSPQADSLSSRMDLERTIASIRLGKPLVETTVDDIPLSRRKAAAEWTPPEEPPVTPPGGGTSIIDTGPAVNATPTSVRPDYSAALAPMLEPGVLTRDYPGMAGYPGGQGSLGDPMALVALPLAGLAAGALSSNRLGLGATGPFLTRAGLDVANPDINPALDTKVREAVGEANKLISPKAAGEAMVHPSGFDPQNPANVPAAEAYSRYSVPVVSGALETLDPRNLVGGLLAGAASTGAEGLIAGSRAAGTGALGLGAGEAAVEALPGKAAAAVGRGLGKAGNTAEDILTGEGGQVRVPGGIPGAEPQPGDLVKNPTGGEPLQYVGQEGDRHIYAEPGNPEARYSSRRPPQPLDGAPPPPPTPPTPPTPPVAPRARRAPGPAPAVEPPPNIPVLNSGGEPTPGVPPIGGGSAGIDPVTGETLPPSRSAESQAARAGVPPPEPPIGGKPPAPPIPGGGGITAPEDNVLHLKPAKGSLTPAQKIEDAFRQAAGQPNAYDEGVTPIFNGRRDVQVTVESQANTVSEKLRTDLKALFPRDKNGLLPTLATPEFPSGPGFRDVTDAPAAFPLNPQQKAAVDELQAALAPYDELAQQVGVSKRLGGPMRAGIDPDQGGFYVPRGKATPEGYEAPPKVRTGARAGSSYGKPAVMDSEADGVAKGLVYDDPVDAVRSYIQDIGRDINEKHTMNQLEQLTETVTDPVTGAVTVQRAAQTAAGRVDPELRSAVQGLRGQIAGRRMTLLRQNEQWKAAGRSAGEAERMMKAADERLQAEAARWGQVIDNTPDDLYAINSAEREVLSLEREAERQAKRAAGKRAGEVAQGAKVEATGQKYDDLRTQLDALRGRWQKAQDAAKQPLRGRSRITGLPESSGTDFPTAMANAAERIFQSEKPKGNAVRTLNAIQRMTSSTGDDSGPGIQALVAAVNDPGAAAQAYRVHWQAALKPEVQGAFFKEYDATGIAKGLPTTSDAARAGLHIADLGSVANELGVGGAGAFEQLPGVKQANRIFTVMTNTTRLSRFRTLVQDEVNGTNGLKLAPGVRVQDMAPRTIEDLWKTGDMERLAAAANRESGWSPEAAFSNVPGLGDVGGNLLYAGRFFQARAEQLVNAMGGLKPNPSLEQRTARNSLIKLFGAATAITVAGNAAQGRSTDLSPLRTKADGEVSYNPNFLALRAAGRDWKLLGPYDSLLGIMINLATLTTVKNVDRLPPRLFELGKPLLAGAPALAGNVTSVALRGKNMWGDVYDRNDPGEWLRLLADAFAPIATEDVGSIGGAALHAAQAGDAGEALKQGAAGAAALSGGKSSALSPTDLVADAGQQAALDAYFGAGKYVAHDLAPDNPKLQAHVEFYLTHQGTEIPSERVRLQEAINAMGDDLRKTALRDYTQLREGLRRDNPAVDANRQAAGSAPLKEPTPKKTNPLALPSFKPAATPKPDYYQQYKQKQSAPQSRPAGAGATPATVPGYEDYDAYRARFPTVTPAPRYSATPTAVGAR